MYIFWIESDVLSNLGKTEVWRSLVFPWDFIMLDQEIAKVSFIWLMPTLCLVSSVEALYVFLFTPQDNPIGQAVLSIAQMKRLRVRELPE